MTLGLGPGPLGPGPLGGPAHQGRGGPLGAQHTKVEVRVAHLLGMHSFDDFRVGPWALRGLGPLGGPAQVRVAHLEGMHSLDDFRVSGLEVRTALILCAHQSRS